MLLKYRHYTSHSGSKVWKINSSDTLCRRGIEHEHFSLVLAGLKEALATGNIDSALEDIKAVEAMALSVIEEWGHAVRTSRAILNKQMENPDAEK